ncbi:MAG TPA: AraC family transcriptional regulator [Chitinophagaceae bacterium]|nr:AraC family transcriptional regulator [Chitinophagaceae bacterium]
MNNNQQSANALFCSFDIYQKGYALLRESKRSIDKNGHRGIIYELGTPDGISIGYYNITSAEKGKVIIENTQPFLQLSYTISGRKKYAIENGQRALASFKSQEYNYLFLTQEKIHLSWEPEEKLEIFEVGISPEVMLRFLPEEHPFFPVFHKSLEKNIPALMSKANLSLRSKSNVILYDMLNCPLEGRYKQLYIKSKIGELLAIQLEEYEQSMRKGAPGAHAGALRQEDIVRMHHVRDIIVSNMNSPCSLIDLAHQVGTNDAYLKKHFKQVFGTTVYGYLQVIKMGEAKRLLMMGQTVSEVAYLTGYKHVAHFTRAFKKHFGVAPHTIKK